MAGGHSKNNSDTKNVITMIIYVHIYSYTVREMVLVHCTADSHYITIIKII